VIPILSVLNGTANFSDHFSLSQTKSKESCVCSFLYSSHFPCDTAVKEVSKQAVKQAVKQASKNKSRHQDQPEPNPGKASISVKHS
jgi:hypothetical protein